MLPTNWYMLLVAAAIPMLVGFFWYGNMGFGKKWMSVNGFTDEDLEGANMGLIMGLSFLFCVMLAFFYSSMVIHQTNVFGLLVPEALEAGSAIQNDFNDFMSKYGDRHRTFRHGAAHGVFATIFFVFPLIAINALFERRGWGYIFIHVGYWFICLVLMGGLICQTIEYAL